LNGPGCNNIGSTFPQTEIQLLVVNEGCAEIFSEKIKVGLMTKKFSKVVWSPV
jgi:hypothetical protein